MHTKCLGIVLIPCYLFLVSLFYYYFLLVYRFQSSFYSRFQTVNISTEHIFIWVVLRLDLNQFVCSLVSPPSFALCLCVSLSIFCKENSQSSLLIAERTICVCIYTSTVWKLFTFTSFNANMRLFLHSMCIYIYFFLFASESCSVVPIYSLLVWFTFVFTYISVLCLFFRRNWFILTIFS